MFRRKVDKLYSNNLDILTFLQNGSHAGAKYTPLMLRIKNTVLMDFKLLIFNITN